LRESLADSCVLLSSPVVGASKNASTPSQFSFSRVVHSVPSVLSILLSPTGCSWSAYRLSVTPTDNANWCQTRASRPLCLTPTPHFLISLIVHLTSPSPLPFRLRPQPIFPPTFVCPDVFAISLGRLSMACTDFTALPTPQSQVSFPARTSYSLCKAGRL
jgi:hypothetical protein